MPAWFQQASGLLTGTPMSTKTPGRNKTSVRPDTIVLGVDDFGCQHVYRTATETIHVVEDGERVHVEHLGNRHADEWMAFVADRRGWSERNYGGGINGAITRAILP